MTRRTIQANGRIYTFSPDDAVPLSERTWALVRARLVDEITGEPPRSAMTIKAEEPGFIPRVASDGLVGLIGIPRRVFPKLATQSYTINVAVTAEGYIPLHTTVKVEQDANFPDTFTPTDKGDLLLHRESIIIRGRSVLFDKGTSTTKPLPGVTIRVTGIWRTFPPATVQGPAAAPDIVSLQPALYFPRPPEGPQPPAAVQLSSVNMVPVMGEDKTLLEWVPKDSDSFKLSNRKNIRKGDVLLIDPLEPDSMEFLPIASIAGASTDDQPARITLTYPLAHPHRDGSLVRKVLVQATGVNNQFAQKAIVGDTCVFLASMNNLSSATTVEITDGSNPDEYHNLSIFSTKSDPAGYFHLPPLSRVAQLEMQADDGGIHKTITQVFSPDYSLRENHIDFIFK
jgi:hypothetical protein